MGLFGSRKKVYVSSSIYNLAGDVTKRPSFMKSVVINKVMSGNPRNSMASVVTNALLGGPGIKLRSFGRWARTSGYTDSLRIQKTHLSNNYALDMEVLRAYIGERVSAEVQIQSVEIDDADHSYWAEQWMLANFPEEFDTEWSADYNDLEKKIYIDRANGAGTTSVYVPEFSRGRKYIYTAYTLPDQTLKIWIYPEGGGSAELDAMFRAGQSVGGFFPPIFVRYDNKFLSPTYKADLYRLGNKAYKKAVGSELSDVVKTLQDNDSLGDIDHAFIMFGASLNSPSTNACRYIYSFFHSMLSDYPGVTSQPDLTDYVNKMGLSKLSIDAVEEWMSNPVGNAPEVVTPPAAPRTSVTMASSRTDIDFSMKIEWASLQKTTGQGMFDSTKKVGECWIQKGGTLPVVKGLIGRAVARTNLAESFESIRIYWQETADSWSCLEIRGLKHTNRVYKGKSVEITAWEALDDEEESGFLVPLHETILKQMSLTNTTQFCTANTYMVLNCYKVVKKKWYQTGIFAVILIIVIIVVSYFYPPAAASLSTTFGGTAAAAAGLTGLAATVAAVAINAIVGMVVLSILTKAGTALFGEKVGAIIGAIGAVVTMQVGTAMMNGATLATAFSGMMSAPNIMGLMNAAGKGYQAYMAASTNEIIGKTQQVMEEYSGAMDEISSKMQELLGTEQAWLDPLAFLDSTNGTIGAESRDSFLARTLMTGSDVAELSLELISEFTNITLDTSSTV